MVAADASGAVPFTINFSNTAGTAGTQVSTTTNSSSVTFDKTAPTVTSITRMTPGTQTINATTVTFQVTFSEGTRGVDVNDFSFFKVSGTVTGTISAVSPASPPNSSIIYNLTVSNISQTGEFRINLKATGTGIVDAADNAITTGFTTGETYIITTAPPITLSGFATINYFTPLNISSHTGQKPQAKTWKFAGKWWAALATEQGTKIFKLVGNNWTDIITLSTANNAKCDVRVVGDVVHLLLFRTSTSYVVSIEYDPATDKYKLWSKRNAKANITFETGTETATMDMDASGRMWIASDGDTDIRVRYSDFPYGTWSAPIVLATGVTIDDICSITTLNDGKIGVFWGNQNTQRFGFRTHANGAIPSTWSADENPASQSALNVGHGFSDDHLQLMLASDGTLYVAMKTSYDTDGYPKIGLLVRRPAGTWDNLYPVTTNLVGTRPMVILNESIGKLKVLYTSLEGGGNILYKEALISDLTNFSQEFTLFNGNYNYLTSTHQTYNPEIAVIVTDQSAVQLTAAGFLGSDAATTSSASITSSPFSKAITLDSTKRSSITSTAEETLFRVYPNPVSTNATVQFSLKETGKYRISLYTTNGVAVSVLSEGWSEADKIGTIGINCSNLKKGVYLIRLKTNNYTTSRKLIIR
jgi:hypothetical protein